MYMMGHQIQWLLYIYVICMHDYIVCIYMCHTCGGTLLISSIH